MGENVKKIYASLDIGSSSIKILVGEVINTNVQVLFASSIPSHGVKKGVIIDEEALKQDIIKLVKEAETSLEAKLTSVLVNIPANQCRLYSITGSTQILSNDHQIRKEDIAKAINKASKFERRKNEALVSTIPIKYYYGEQSSYDLPIGKTAYSLQVDVLAITTTKKALYPYIRVVEGAGLEIMYISVNAYSAAKEVFDEAYLKDGAVLIDVGHRSTTVSYFEDGFLKYITVASVGGYDLTKKIALEWQIPLSKAETYKIKYGSCNMESNEQDVIHSISEGSHVTHYTKHDLACLLNEGCNEIMEKVKEKLAVLGEDRKFETVIIGGGGEIEDFDQVASKSLGRKVRIYRPQVMGARKLNMVSSLGLIYYLLDRNKIHGDLAPSLLMPEVSSTMTMKLKGLTKTNTTQIEGKFKKIIDRFVTEEE